MERRRCTGPAVSLSKNPGARRRERRAMVRALQRMGCSALAAAEPAACIAVAAGQGCCVKWRVAIH